MPPSRLSEAQKAAARRAYQTDPAMTLRALADAYGVGTTVMHRVLAGVTRPRGGQRKSKLSDARIAKMWIQDQLTLAEIGRQAGLTESGVYRAIERWRESQAK